VLDVVVRPALGEELLAAARVYVAADDESDMRLYGRSRRDIDEPGEDPESAALADLSMIHAEAPGQVLVAVSGEGQVVGLAAVVVRGRHWHLVYLFVLPRWQNQGVGRALLEQSRGAGVDAGCDRFTLCASDEPAALTRYLSLGLAPAHRWWCSKPRRRLSPGRGGTTGWWPSS
jgi:GNAT superfamily N-acetyltransferase